MARDKGGPLDHDDPRETHIEVESQKLAVFQSWGDFEAFSNTFFHPCFFPQRNADRGGEIYPEKWRGAQGPLEDFGSAIEI